jgi:hypothetical protein
MYRNPLRQLQLYFSPKDTYRVPHCKASTSSELINKHSLHDHESFIHFEDSPLPFMLFFSVNSELYHLFSLFLLINYPSQI